MLQNEHLCVQNASVSDITALYHDIDACLERGASRDAIERVLEAVWSRCGLGTGGVGVGILAEWFSSACGTIVSVGVLSRGALLGGLRSALGQSEFALAQIVWEAHNFLRHTVRPRRWYATEIGTAKQRSRWLRTEGMLVCLSANRLFCGTPSAAEKAVGRAPSRGEVLLKLELISNACHGVGGVTPRGFVSGVGRLRPFAVALVCNVTDGLGVADIRLYDMGLSAFHCIDPPSSPEGTREWVQECRG
jgi:hypothetical protein